MSGYIDCLGYKYLGGINIRKYKYQYKYQYQKYLPPCKDKSCEIAEQIRKSTYSKADQVILLHRDAHWPID